MEKTTWSWMRKGAAVLFALLVACCCMLLAGCAENSEDAVRKAATSELDQIKNMDAATLEEIAGDSSEFDELSTYGITTTDAYDAIFGEFDYTIEGIKVDGDKATVTAKFTAKDLSQFQSALTEAAEKAQADGTLNATSQSELNTVIGQLVLDTINGLPTTETEPVDLECAKVNGEWQLTDNAADAMQEAMFPSSVLGSL